MKTLLVILVSIFFIYLLIKLGIYFYRPFFIKKILNEIQMKRDSIMRQLEADINDTSDKLIRMQAGDKIALFASSEEAIKKSIADAIDSKDHFIKIYETYIRLREKFNYDRKTSIKTILTYKRYLDLRLKQISDAGLYTKMLELGSISFDEWLASANEIRIMIDENEKRLEAFLDNY